jgi:hypothetical protein
MTLDEAPEPSGKISKESCAPRRSEQLGVIIVNRTFSDFAASDGRNELTSDGDTKYLERNSLCSRSPVSEIDRFRRGPIMPASLKVCRLPRRDMVAKTLGFDCWKPCAPGIGEKDEAVKRVEGSCPHHPANLSVRKTFQRE